jgi:hypothetical protein
MLVLHLRGGLFQSMKGNLHEIGFVKAEAIE